MHVLRRALGWILFLVCALGVVDALAGHGHSRGHRRRLPVAAAERGGSVPVAVCGNGAVESPEMCDDGGTVAGDGCSATCTIEGGWTCNTADPSVCHPLSAEAAQPSVNTLCGQPNHLEGNTRIVTQFRIRKIGAGEFCSGQTAQPIYDVHTNATDALFRITCNDDGAGAGNELRIQIFNGTGAVNCTTTDLELVTADGWPLFLVDMNLSSGVVLYVLSHTIGRRQISVSCDAALPAAFDSTSVNAELELRPSGGVSYGAGEGLDDIIIWDNIGPSTAQQVWDFWGESAGHEGEFINPNSAPWGAPSNWLTMGDDPADNGTTINDVIGTNDCTGTITYATTLLPMRSRLDTELTSILTRTFTLADGAGSRSETSNSQTGQVYPINPIGPFRYGLNQERVFYSNGAAHINANHRIHYGNTLNNGGDWFWTLGATAANYPWSTETETVVEPSQAPSTTNIEGGNRGVQLTPILSDYDSQQGGALLLFNTTYTVSPTVRPGGGLLSNRHLDTLTYTEDRDGGANSVNFFTTTNGNSVRNAIGGSGVELPNGDMLYTTYGHDTGSGCINGGNQIRLWRSTGPHGQDESWASASTVVFDGCVAGASGGFRPVEPSLTRWIQAPGDGSPNIHGRVYLTFKVDDTAPTGGATGTFTTLYADNVAADPTLTPDWFNASDDSDATTTSVDWTQQNAGSNHNRIIQLASGTLVIAGRAQNGQSDILSTSITRGATWVNQGRISAISTVGSGAVGADVKEVAPNQVSVVVAYERNNNPGISRMIYGEVSPSAIPTGPLTWSNSGWCRYNDGGAANEGHTLFGYDVMEGLADGAIAFRLHTDDGTANKALIQRWGAAGADQAWRVRALSTEAIAIDMGAHHCETSASAFSTNTNHSVAVGLDGSVPSVAVYVDGSAVACDQNVTGAVPSTWPTSSARIYVGIAYDGTSEPCTTCFLDEIVLYNGITFSSAARAAALIGADPRTVDITGDSTADWPLAYYRCEGENSALSVANGGTIAENWGYWPTWAMPLNLEVADLGAAP